MRHSAAAARVARVLALAAIVTVVPRTVPPAGAEAPQQTKLTAAKGSAEALFGTSVSIDGTTAVVGAPDEGGVGAAYVFRKREGTWVEQATLTAPAGSPGGKFGYDVAIAGDTIVVGAPDAEQTDPLAEAGAAYVFVRNQAAWPLQQKLTPSDSRADDAFGFGVAISGDTILVGANAGTVVPNLEAGAAYVFNRVGNAWSEQAKLTPADGAPHDNFGYSVALSGDTAVVGMPGDDVGGAVEQGSVRVFRRAGSTWAEQATLTAADGLPGDQFGEATSIFGDTVVAGAYYATLGFNPAQGAAYVFEHGASGWGEKAKLVAPDGTAKDMFGRAVAVSDRHVAVGAHFEEGEGQGAVYVFDRHRFPEAVPTKLTAPATGILGVSVWISGRTLISGASFTAVDGKSAQGAAFITELGR